MDSAAAKRMLHDILDGLPAHRNALIDEKAALSALSERFHHAKTDVWPLRSRILDMHRSKIFGGLMI